MIAKDLLATRPANISVAKGKHLILRVLLLPKTSIYEHLRGNLSLSGFMQPGTGTDGHYSHRDLGYRSGLSLLFKVIEVPGNADWGSERAVSETLLYERSHYKKLEHSLQGIHLPPPFPPPLLPLQSLS